MPTKIPRHKVFISYHDEDRRWKERSVRQMGDRIIDRSVKVGNIDDRNIKTDTIRQKIREGFIRDASVTIVLIGPGTWQRRHVDWEISYSLRQTSYNYRCGLLGIILPSHSDHGKSEYNERLIPPRLADNSDGNDPYAEIHDWPKPWAPAQTQRWIHRAFVRRRLTTPSNSRPQFVRNRRGDYMRGWQN